MGKKEPNLHCTRLSMLGIPPSLHRVYAGLLGVRFALCTMNLTRYVGRRPKLGQNRICCAVNERGETFGSERKKSACHPVCRVPVVILHVCEYSGHSTFHWRGLPSLTRRDERIDVPFVYFDGRGLPVTSFIRAWLAAHGRTIGVLVGSCIESSHNGNGLRDAPQPSGRKPCYGYDDWRGIGCDTWIA